MKVTIRVSSSDQKTWSTITEETLDIECDCVPDVGPVVQRMFESVVGKTHKHEQKKLEPTEDPPVPIAPAPEFQPQIPGDEIF